MAKNKTRLIIGVSGGSGSGKTTFATALVAKLAGRAKLLYQDNYYIDQSDKFDFDGGSVNFDHPDSLEFSLIAEHLKMLRMGNSINVPIYDFSTHRRLDDVIIFHPPEILILDGILIFAAKELDHSMDLRVFIETPEILRYERRLKRDVEERGRQEQGVKAQFYGQVKPMHDQFVTPSKNSCHLIYSGEEDFENSLCDVLKKVDLALS
jgi:uridine kinase